VCSPRKFGLTPRSKLGFGTLILPTVRKRCDGCIFDIHGSAHHDKIFTKMTNKMQLYRIIYCSSTALHASRDIFAHNQEHLNCMYSFWIYSRVSLSAAVMAE